MRATVAARRSPAGGFCLPQAQALRFALDKQFP